MRLAAAALMAAVVGTADAHGQMNAPPSTRQGIAGKTWPGALSGQGAGGYCEQPASENKGNPLNGAWCAAPPPPYACCFGHCARHRVDPLVSPLGQQTYTC